jgi:hypothetical protein
LALNIDWLRLVKGLEIMWRQHILLLKDDAMSCSVKMSRPTYWLLDDSTLRIVKGSSPLPRIVLSHPTKVSDDSKRPGDVGLPPPPI